MNVFVKVNGLEVRVTNTSKEHVNNIISAAIKFANGVDDDIEITSDIGDLDFIESKEEKEPKYHPGMKVLPNGDVIYRCAYKCPCGKHGRRYIKDMNDPVYCHQCNEKLQAQPSTLNDACDEDENYFLAY